MIITHIWIFRDERKIAHVKLVNSSLSFSLRPYVVK